MTMRTSDTWSWMDDVLPFVAMLVATCLDMALLTVVKAALNDGMSSIVYVIYHNAIGTLILLPFFILHIIRKVDRPPLTFRVLFRFFILGLLGICLFQVLWYVGVDYSSPTMASAILNLAPGITFLIAVIFRMEKIDIRSSSSVAKLLGTLIAISGAMAFTFYQGPTILNTIRSPNSPDHLYSSQPSEWIYGSVITLISVIFACIWVVLQTTTATEFPDEQTIVFFYCLFGTLVCVALAPFIERNRSAWVLRSGTRVTAVVLGVSLVNQTTFHIYIGVGRLTYFYLKGVQSTVVHNSVLTWCLRKKGPVFVAMFSPLTIVLAVIMGVAFLGDSLHLGSAIGAAIVAVGFYTVTWGQAKEKNEIRVVIGDDSGALDEPGSSDQTAPLLSSRNESEC